MYLPIFFIFETVCPKPVLQKSFDFPQTGLSCL
jgi:hypothetical protein